ncbi:MAG: PhnD/SsuA/transferrin family substrate-binding protein [Myxococcota bacterium]
MNITSTKMRMRARGALSRRAWLRAAGGLSTAALVGGGGGCREPVEANKEAQDALMALRPAGADPSVLRIGITPSTGASTGTRLAPLLDYLARAFEGRKTIEEVTARDYDHLAVLVREEAIEVGIFSPLSYVKALQAHVEAVAIATATRNGSPTYLGYLVARAADFGERLPQLEAFAGRRVVWVNRSSTSGYLYPRAMMRARGLDPDAFFGASRFAGDHQTALDMVRTGEADIAATASSFIDADAVRMNPAASAAPAEDNDASRLVAVAKTRHIPLDCVVVHKRLQRNLGVALRTALEQIIHDPARADERLGETWGLNGFVRPVSYREVAEVYARS